MWQSDKEGHWTRTTLGPAASSGTEQFLDGPLTREALVAAMPLTDGRCVEGETTGQRRIQMGLEAADARRSPPGTLPAPPHEMHLDRSLKRVADPLLDDGQGGVEGELGAVGAAVSQQQGAGLGPAARRQQPAGGRLHVPASLPLVGQHVGAERGVQRRGDAAHQEPGVQQQREQLGVAGGGRLLEERDESGEKV
ncbi:hypothetical protein EYF80_018174 [Liparis tanakae]|uniref:Uncharacterized protein n=1 Tax=Liparis tanakae TaxID=230148 RepID=A0A4Z2I0K8_9TELE|nr:hypothetical protein EYF80_018174 [Liparis tanakae]